MPSPLDILPTELFLHVVSFLRHQDLVLLSCVSRNFQKTIEPVLWSKIELHRPLFHEDYAHKVLRENEAVLERFYHYPHENVMKDDNKNTKAWDSPWKHEWERKSDQKVTEFLWNFEEKMMSDRARAEYLASLVRWLCLPVLGTYRGNYEFDRDGAKFDPWNALAMFTNLEYLEVSAFWEQPRLVEPFKVPQHPAPKLHTLKLRGYVPAEFVRYLCQSAETIMELHLGILDAPIGSLLFEPRRNPPPPGPGGSDAKGDLEEEEAKGQPKDEIMEVPEDEGEERRENKPGGESENEEQDEDLEQEQIAPRPLACLTPSIISKFTSLTTLYLYRPSQSIEITDDMGDIYVSVKSDTQILREWASLLRATRKTLKEVTLEQKPVANENEPDGTGNNEFMMLYCHGPGYQRFVDIVLPVLLEDAVWPALHSIRLFGFESYGMSYAGYEPEEGVDLMKQLKNRFPGVEVHSELGRRMLFLEETGEVEGYGDVLDCLNGFSDSENDE